MSHGTTITRLRTGAGLSRRALAARAGVAVSTVSKIETGEMDPTVTMLERLVAAAGHELVLDTPEPGDMPAIADLADAWRDGTEPGPDWTRIRGLTGWLARHPAAIPGALRRPPRRTGSERLDALLAGLAEKVADDAGLPRPRWAAAVPPLDEPWEITGTPRMRARSRTLAPQQFRDRNIWLSARNAWRRPGRHA